MSDCTPNLPPYHVYFVTVPSGAVKIGVAKDVTERLRALQVGHHEPIHLAFSLEVATKEIAHALEATLHERYQKHRLAGEWFTVAIDDLLADFRFAIAFARTVKTINYQKSVATPVMFDEGMSARENQWLYQRAVTFIQRKRKASAGMLQNHFRIDALRAEQLIDRMLTKGILLPLSSGADAHEVADSDLWLQAFMDES